MRHAKYGKIIAPQDGVPRARRDRTNRTMGDTVEIVESRRRSKTKRWELVRIVTKSRAVDIAAMRAAAKTGRRTAELKRLGRNE